MSAATKAATVTVGKRKGWRLRVIPIGNDSCSGPPLQSADPRGKIASVVGPTAEFSRVGRRSQGRKFGGRGEQATDGRSETCNVHRLERDTASVLRRFTQRSACRTNARLAPRQAFNDGEPESLNLGWINGERAGGIGGHDFCISERSVVAQRTARRLQNPQAFQRRRAGVALGESDA